MTKESVASYDTELRPEQANVHEAAPNLPECLPTSVAVSCGTGIYEKWKCLPVYAMRTAIVTDMLNTSDQLENAIPAASIACRIHMFEFFGTF